MMTDCSYKFPPPLCHHGVDKENFIHFLYLIYLYIYLFVVCLTALLEIQSVAFSVEQLDY